MVWFVSTCLLVAVALVATFDRAWVVGLHRTRALGYATGVSLSIAAAPAVAWLLLALLAVYDHLTPYPPWF